MAELQTASDKMSKTSLEWLEIVMSLPNGSQRFEGELATACRADNLPADHAICLAYTALTIEDSGQVGVMQPWYRERAMELLCRAVNVVEAEAESRQADTVN